MTTYATGCAWPGWCNAGRYECAVAGAVQVVGCDECFELLDAYVELELAGSDAGAEMPLLRAHLRGCSACRDDYDSLRTLLLSADPGEPA